MKSTYAIIGSLFLLFGSTAAKAQDAKPSHMLSLDVGHFVYSLVQPGNTILIPLEYEAAVAEYVSLFVAPRFAVRAGAVGLGLGLGARFYLINGPPISGLWLGPEVGVLYVAANSTAVGAAFAFSLGGSFGYNLVLGESLVLSPGLNLGVIGLGSPAAAFDWSPRLVVGYAF